MTDDNLEIKLLPSEEKKTIPGCWSEELKKKWTANLFVGCLLLFSSRNTMAVCVPAISKELGWDKELSGMVLSAFFCGYVGSNIIGGYFADFYGGAKTIMYSSFIWAFLTMILPFLSGVNSTLYSTNFAILTLRFLTGCTQGFFFPSMSSLIAKHVETSRKGVILGIIYSGCPIGIIMTGFFGSLLIENGQWHVVFISNGLLSLIWVFWLRHLCHETKNLQTLTNSPKPLRESRKVWTRILQHSSIWALFVGFFGAGCTYAVLNSWTPAYFHDKFPQSKGWIFNVVPWLLSFLFENVTGYYANAMLHNGKSVAYVRKLYAAYLFLGTMVFSLLLMYVTNFTQALILMSLTAGFTAFGSSSLSVNPQDLCPDQAGALFGIANAIAAISGSIGVYLTGAVLAKAADNWSLVFMSNALISFLSFVIFLLFGSTEAIA